jgi:hypothetical protein
LIAPSSPTAEDRADEMLVRCGLGAGAAVDSEGEKRSVVGSVGSGLGRMTLTR